jgi:hypothetical protein
MARAKAAAVPVVETRRMKIADLLPADYNPRRISDKALKGLRASLERFGELGGIVYNEQTGRLVGGHQRVKALAALGVVDAEVRVVSIPIAEEKAANLALNHPGIGGEWDEGMLAAVLADVQRDLPTAFDELQLGDLWAEADAAIEPGEVDEDDAPEPPARPVTRRGDIWLCGPHRIMCGDSITADVGVLVPEGTRAALLHADPPYGMGKEIDGVANDNLHNAELDEFQMSWWRQWRPFLANNGSAYIWGTAQDLWRLWYAGGLESSERMTFRNEVVWDKSAAQAMTSEALRQFPTATERCLFFMLGEQGTAPNAEDFFEGYESLRAALEQDARNMGWGAADIKRICGVGMWGHWFTRSQWALIPREQYVKLQAAAHGGDAFKRDHDELKRDHDELKREFLATRAYFDNGHEAMRDVWNFERVHGDERHGHATPKPVAMIVRAIKSAAPSGAVVLEPFSGSGTTLVAAESCGRACYTMELTPEYVDVAVQRWQAFTGKAATLDGDGRTFDEVKGARHGATD